MPTGQDAWQAQQAYIWDLINAQAQPGGSLPDLKIVEHIAPPEKGIFPCAGVMFTDFDEEFDASRQHMVIARFDIVVQLEAKADPKLADTGARALAALDAYISVISPLLRMDPTLGGLAQSSRITRFQRAPLRTETGTAVSAVMAYWQLRTEKPVKF